MFIETTEWILMDEANSPVILNSTYKDFRGDLMKVIGGYPPKHEASTGRVVTDKGSFFPSVIKAEWVQK